MLWKQQKKKWGRDGEDNGTSTEIHPYTLYTHIFLFTYLFTFDNAESLQRTCKKACDGTPIHIITVISSEQKKKRKKEKKRRKKREFQPPFQSQRNTVERLNSRREVITSNANGEVSQRARVKGSNMTKEEKKERKEKSSTSTITSEFIHSNRSTSCRQPEFLHTLQVRWWEPTCLV